MYSRLYNLHVDIFKNKNNINNLVINFALLPKTIGCSFKFLQSKNTNNIKSEVRFKQS
jgi:hypothetical protein